MARDGISVRVTKSGRIIPARLDNGALTRIGDSMVEAQLKRWSLGLNANGNAARQLANKSFFEKRAYLKKTGANRAPIRDNNMTGSLVKNFSLRKAISGTIRAEPTQRTTRSHANRAQFYEEMIGFSGPEQVKIYEKSFEEYGKIFTKAWVPIVNG
jgi:hypothetical protein